MPVVKIGPQNVEGVYKQGTAVTVKLVSTNASTPGYTGSGMVIGQAVTKTVESDTATPLQFTLTANSLITPANTYYEYTYAPPGREKAKRGTFQVPNTAGPFDVEDILYESPAAVETPALSGHITAATGAHAGSAISVTPTGTLTADDVQEALADIALQAAKTRNIQRLRERRIGHMNTGKATIAFRDDDGNVTTYTTAFPLFRDRNLVFTLGIPSANVNQATYITTAQFVEMIEYGNEGASHSQTHSSDPNDYLTEAQLQAEIVNSKTDLEALDDLIRVDAWVTPGPSNLLTSEANWTARQGQLVMANYLVAAGYTFDIHRWYGQESYGAAPYSIDDKSLADIKARIDQAVANRDSVVFSFHAHMLGDSGKLSVADFTSVLQYVRDLQDSGQIENLTMTGALLAQQYGEWEDLIREGDFADLPYANSTWGPWTATGAPTLATDGGRGSPNYVRCSSTAYVAQTKTRVEDSDAPGSHYRLRGWVRNSAGGGTGYVVTLKDSTNTANLNVILTDAPGTTWELVERCVTIPVGLGDLTLELKSDGAGLVDFSSFELRRL